MTRRTYKITLAVLGAVCLILAPLLARGLVDPALGTVAFVAVIGWIVFGVAKAHIGPRAGRR